MTVVKWERGKGTEVTHHSPFTLSLSPSHTLPFFLYVLPPSLSLSHTLSFSLSLSFAEDLATWGLVSAPPSVGCGTAMQFPAHLAFRTEALSVGARQAVPFRQIRSLLRPADRYFPSPADVDGY